MREFKIEDWRNENIVTRDGRSVRILCINRLHNYHTGPVIALVKGRGGKFEQLIQYDQYGKQINHAPEYDLFINEDED